MSDEFGGFDEDEDVETEKEDTKEDTEEDTEEEEKHNKAKAYTGDKLLKRAYKIRKEKKQPINNSKREKIISKIIKKSNTTSIPDVNDLFIDRSNMTKMKISDIAVFINDDQEDEVLQELANNIPLRNSINLSTEVNIVRVIDVAIQIVECGKIFLPIEVVKLEDGTNQIECWSGRHRLTSLALLYGEEVEIPVSITSMTTVMARDAVVYANQSRRSLGLEKSEHSILRNSGGEIDTIDRSELYEKTAVSKPKSVDFAIFSTLSQNIKDMKLDFDVSKTSSRKNGELTTVVNLKGYFRSILSDWTKKTQYKDWEKDVCIGIGFLNSIVNEFEQIAEFNPKQHLSAQSLVALGHIHNRLILTNQDESINNVNKIAKIIVNLGDIGRMKSEEIIKLFQTEYKKSS